MTRASRVCAVSVFALAWIAATGPPARAQSAEAEALFRDGRVLIKAGKLAQGCDKLAASERLETSIGTLLNVGDCREKLGKLASAWAAFRKAEAMAKRAGGDDKRQAEAGRRAAQLEPRLANLVIDVSHRVGGLTIRRDGEVVDEALWNTPMPVDPGTYAIAAEAPGRVAWSRTVAVGPGARREVVTIPSLANAPPEPVAAPWPPPRVPVQPAAMPVAVATRRSGTWTTTRAVSVGVAIAGAAALGTGAYFGVHARTLQDRADQRCPLAVCSDPEGLRLNDQAQTSASRANILYVAGGAALAAGVVLWLVGAPGETVVAPMAGDHQLGVAMTGRF